MSFIKLGETIEINSSSIHDQEVILSDPEIINRFQKFAGDLKRIAPKANDFLYFSAVMMHAAEAALVNPDGTTRLTLKGEPVKAHWEKNNGSWKWVSNDPNLKPYKNCFPSGTKILLEDGSVKNIEDIKVGDYVITHKGRSKKVLKTFITPHNGKLLELKVKNNEKIVCTPEHPFYHADLSDFNRKGLNVLNERRRNNSNFKIDFKFSKVSDLKIGDLLTSPILHDKINNNINPNRAKLLGLFAAEGSFSKKHGKRQSLIFTLGINENNTANLIKEIFEEEFPECSVNINSEPLRSIITVSASGKNITEYFYYHVGEFSDNKKLSKELVFSDDDSKKNFICGWLDGDGCVSDHNKLIGVTSSKNLAYQVRTILNSLYVSNSIRKNDKCKRKINNKYKEYDCKESYRVEIYGNGYSKLDLEELSSKYTFNKINHKNISNFNDDYFLHTIRDINEIDFCGDVYNFEVEDDNSYVANGLITHNCNGDIFPEEELLKAYRNWVGKPLCIDHKSNSVDAIRGIILDTYYDLNLKRVIALCALDKKSYPELARKVSTGTSTSVSMGTGVGMAVCYDCGQSARSENDFCNHMRTKSCYGEINIDLQPIELSIVVNGADPQAKIKHIIAATNNLNKYLEIKEGELSSNNFRFEKIKDIENELKKASDKLSELKSEIENEKSEPPYGATSGTISESDVEVPQTNESLNQTNVQRFASSDLIKEFDVLKNAVEEKIKNIEATIENSLTNLINKLDNKKEENMSGNINKSAYFQGGGDVNEPTPGQKKYPVDPMNEDLRLKGDKQMLGQHNLDTGPVDGMHPGTESSGMSDEERKKMLARAEIEQRAMRRAAALKNAKDSLMSHKEAYFQGGGGVNEPTPHKVKYTKDPMNEKLREDEDKQMVGQKPFPGVGNVESLHPSPMSADQKDELKRKELLQRASLKARFIKAANSDGSDNLDRSSWQVFANDKLVLTASVGEISGGRSEVLFDTIATREFGSRMLEKIKEVGLEKASNLYKGAQAVSAPGVTPGVPADVGTPSPVPADAGAPVDMPEPSASEKPEGDTGTANKDMAKELAKEVKTKASDLAEVVDTLVGEKAEMEEVAPAEVGTTSTASLKVMRKEINAALIDNMKKSIAELKDHEDELNLIASILEENTSETNKDYIQSIVNDAFVDAKHAIADSNKLLGAFVKYARGTEELLKKESSEKSLLKKQADDMMSMDAKDEMYADDEMMADDVSDEELEKLLSEEDFGDDMDLGEMELEEDVKSADDMNYADTVKVKVPGTSGEVEVPMGSKVEAAKEFDLTTKEGRAAYRAKLAAEVQFSDILEDAHKDVDGQTKLDVKPSDELGKVEDLEEQHKKDMDVATAPPKVRKDAERIQQLISEGKLDPQDLEGLVAQGLDPEVVKYWKQYYGQAGSEGSNFASELLKEHVKAKFDEEINNFKVKIARAYELANDMVRRGLLADERMAVSAQVEEIMKWNDEAFESMKRVIAKHTPSMKKDASRIPQVGQINFDENTRSDVDFASELSMAFASKRY